MSVVIETTLGDITVDLYLEQRPATCLNFLKLCKMKYYNFNLFHTIRNGFIAQTGDPSGEGSGGESIWGLLEGSSKRFFSGEKMPKIRHTDAGLLSMVCTDDMMVGSQFFFTLAPDLDSLDGVHCVIGEVTEGHEVLTKLNEVICDETHRPYQDVRITHTVILEDPFNDLPGLRAPSRSPSPNPERLKGGRIAPDEEIDETQGKSHEEIQEMIEEKEAKARATILEIVGDLPDADIAPPENVLFVCKLNPVTTDDDLEIIFSRFGKIVSCEVIRDKKTGDSLQYAFIEFEDKKSCEDAYFKMDNVLIDDRRIHVDFSQSVSKMRWLGKGRGVQYFNEKNSKHSDSQNERSKRSYSREKNDNRRHYKDRKNRERDDRDKTHRNDKRHNHLHRERDRSRSRSRRDRSHNRHTKNDRNQRDQHYSKESRTEKSSKNNNDNSNRPENNRHDHYDKNRKSPTRPDRNDRREHSRSPIRKNKDNKEHNRRDRKEKVHDRRSSKSHNTNKKESKEANHKLTKRNSDSKYRKASKEETHEVEPHTPSPELDKSKIASKTKKQKINSKNNVKRNKKRRKPSTSSSDSDTSDSSTSTSESSSFTDGESKKRRRKRRHSSSSSSTSSSSSSTSSCSTSSDSSNSSSDSESNKKRRRKNENKKSSKKPKKKL